MPSEQGFEECLRHPHKTMVQAENFGTGHENMCNQYNTDVIQPDTCSYIIKSIQAQNTAKIKPKMFSGFRTRMRTGPLLAHYRTAKSLQNTRQTC